MTNGTGKRCGRVLLTTLVGTPPAGAGLVSVEIDLSTGYLAGPLCPRSHVATVHLHPDAVPTVTCPIHNPDGVTIQAEGTVPVVESLSMIQAVGVLESAGYDVHLAWALETPYLPGTIIGQFPAAGTALGVGGVVEIVASGPQPGTVAPDVVGRDHADALARLDAAGLVVAEVFIAASGTSSAATPLRVWAQAPAPGEPVDGKVTIWLSP